MGCAAASAFSLRARARNRQPGRGRSRQARDRSPCLVALQRAPRSQRRLHAHFHLASGGADRRPLSADRRRPVQLFASLRRDVRAARRRPDRLSRPQPLPDVFRRVRARGRRRRRVDAVALCRGTAPRASPRRRLPAARACPRRSGGTGRRCRARADRYRERRDFRAVDPHDGAWRWPRRAAARAAGDGRRVNAGRLRAPRAGLSPHRLRLQSAAAAKPHPRPRRRPRVATADARSSSKSAARARPNRPVAPHSASPQPRRLRFAGQLVRERGAQGSTRARLSKRARDVPRPARLDARRHRAASPRRSSPPTPSRCSAAFARGRLRA